MFSYLLIIAAVIICGACAACCAWVARDLRRNPGHPAPAEGPFTSRPASADIAPDAALPPVPGLQDAEAAHVAHLLRGLRPAGHRNGRQLADRLRCRAVYADDLTLARIALALHTEVFGMAADGHAAPVRILLDALAGAAAELTELDRAEVSQ